MTPDHLTSPPSLSAPLSAPTTTVETTVASGEVDVLCDFLRLIGTLPKEYQVDFYRALERMVSDVERRRRILETVQESLAQMRTDLKYLVFDLEATRRERDEYRRLLTSEGESF